VFQLSIVMVNFRTPKFVTDCLTTLLPDLSCIDARVVVVDNQSGDDSPEVIRSWLQLNDLEARVLFVQAPSNSGFASGNNIGISALKAKNYLLLNSDTLIRQGAISTLMATVDEFPDAGLFSPRLEWPDGAGQESCFRYHTPVSELIVAAQTGGIDKLLSRYLVPLPVQENIIRPQWTSFACVLIRDEVFQSVGLLDDGYFMYYEDVEFCHRAVRAGWQIVHNPKARVVHLRGGSSPVKEHSRLKKRLPKYFYESRTRFFYQAYGGLGLLMANLMWWAGRLVSFSRQMLGRPDKAAIEGQWLDIWTNWLRPLTPYTKKS
jgi:hypothetical protein